MRNKYFNTVVKKISKHRWKLLDVDKLKKIVSDILDDEYTDQKMYKMIYYLKNRGYLQSLKKNIYFSKDPDSVYLDQQLLEMFYWNVVKKHCKTYLQSDWYIGGIKALELNISSYDVPEELLVVNRYKQSTEVVMFDKKVMFKKYYVEDKKLFNLFFKFTHNIYIKNNVFPIANLELALLESLYNTPLLLQGYVNELVKKILRKYKKQLDHKVWDKILLNNKHHSSMNRLYKIAQLIDPDLSEVMKKSIKRFSYFINT